jgi:uncharacterized membrane protein required for colicin V production
MTINLNEFKEMTENPLFKLLPPLFAIVSIATICCVALGYGLDGAIIASCIGSISGLGGYAISKIKN